MKQTAVEWLADKMLTEHHSKIEWYKIVEQAKAMEKKEKLKHSLFIGKVTEILGFDKTVELLKQCDRAKDDSRKLRGARRDILYINECNNVTFDAYNELAIRTRKEVYLDFNPANEFWVHTELKDESDSDF